MQATFEEEGVWRDLAPVDWAICSAMGGGMMATAGWLVPRAVAERAGPWSATRSPNDDGEYFNRVILASERVLFTRGARVFYRSGVDGWSQARSASAVAGLLESYESIEKHLRAAEDSPRTREAAATLYQRFIFDVYPGHAALVRRAEQAVVRLGGSPLRPPSGGVFGKVSRLTGWKVAKRIQTLARLVSHR
ncbi:MAG: glycosyl transferase family 2 [Gemmatimonadetes bacterium]|nr:glycosyl transferase family 2 [Gemmatimonadota bacterium]